MNLETTFIYLISGISAMFMFGFLIFFIGMIVVLVIDHRNLKNKKTIPLPSDDVPSEQKREAQKLAIAERGLKAFTGEQS
jgi:hypothetical protein